MYQYHSLVPRPTPFFVLQFVIHGTLPLPCIVLHANQRTKKNGAGLGMRLPEYRSVDSAIHADMVVDN